ncbi:trans-sialidase [Trypanosoma cruzi]|nr:trans-sialidase [Trypanosoma cruzi]
MHGNAATSIPLTRDAAINGLERVRGTIGIPRNHNHAPPLTQHRIIPWDAVGCNNVGFYQPLFVLAQPVTSTWCQGLALFAREEAERLLPIRCPRRGRRRRTNGSEGHQIEPFSSGCPRSGISIRC